MPGLFHGTSLEQPVTCEHCKQPVSVCACPKTAEGAALLPQHQHPRVRREKRRGKWSTIIADLDPHATDHKALLKQLRTALGTGGGLTSKTTPTGESIELVLQGDHKQAVVEQLIALGYKAKPAGG